MAMIEINWRPSLRELRAFAAIWLVFFGLIGVWFCIDSIARGQQPIAQMLRALARQLEG